MRTVARFYDDNGELVDQLEPDNPDNNCYGYNTGQTGEMCGGCDGCLMMQAIHYGAEYKWEDIDEEGSTLALPEMRSHPPLQPGDWLPAVPTPNLGED